MKIDLNLRVRFDNGGFADLTIDAYEARLDTDDDVLISRLFEALVEHLSFEEAT